MSFKLAAGILLCLQGLLSLGLAQVTIDVLDVLDFVALQDAFEEGDVTATFANDLTADTWTTIVVPANRRLVIEAVDPSKRLKFTNIRFEVEAREESGDDDDYHLTFKPDVKVFTTIDADVFEGIQDLNGGALNVQSGASVLFEGYVRCVGISIASALVGNGDADHRDNGGCWYNEGKIRAEGAALFKRCENSGGGENYPGGGGAIYNHASGVVELPAGITAKYNDCNDDEGGEGGAIWNGGKFTVGGSAIFSSNIGGWGGGIYNEEGATFDFQTDTTLSFYDNNPSAHNDGGGGHISNRGSMTFESYVKFLKGETINTYGLMEFRGGALFKNIEHGAITARDDYDFGGTRHLMEFKNNIAGEYSDCADLNYTEDGEFLCWP